MARLSSAIGEPGYLIELADLRRFAAAILGSQISSVTYAVRPGDTPRLIVDEDLHDIACWMEILLTCSRLVCINLVVLSLNKDRSYYRASAVWF